MAETSESKELLSLLKEHIRPGNIAGAVIVTGFDELKAKTVATVAKYEHAVPARQETYRHVLTVGVVAVVVVWLLVLLSEAVRNNSQAVAPLLWTIGGVVAVLGAERAITSALRKPGNTLTSG